MTQKLQDFFSVIVCRQINALFLGIIRNSFRVLKPVVYLVNIVFNVRIVNRKCGSRNVNYYLFLDYTVLLLKYI